MRDEARKRQKGKEEEASRYGETVVVMMMSKYMHTRQTKERNIENFPFKLVYIKSIARDEITYAAEIYCIICDYMFFNGYR